MTENSEKNISIIQLAEMAGVSPSTIQNVLHERTSHVSLETYKKVKKIIKETGYVHQVASNLLAGKSSRIVGVIVKNNPVKATIQFLYYNFLFALERELYENEFYLVFHVVDKVEEISVFSKKWRLCGIILLGMDEEEMNEINKEMKVTVSSYKAEKTIGKQIRSFVNAVKSNV